MQNNQWLGGERGGWERGPYYVDGLLPLAYLLDDDELKEKADKWIAGFLDDQQSDGWIGPLNPASHHGQYTHGLHDMFSSGPLTTYRPFSDYSETGAIGTPELATAEKGEQIYERLGDELEILLQELHNQVT